jgi:hypothetical protein
MAAFPSAKDVKIDAGKPKHEVKSILITEQPHNPRRWITCVYPAMMINKPAQMIRP